jgi:hypothetical protein
MCAVVQWDWECVTQRDLLQFPCYKSVARKRTVKTEKISVE